MTNADKSTIVVVVASLILFINIILYFIRFTYQVKESFSTSPTSTSSTVIFNDGDLLLKDLHTLIQHQHKQLLK